MLQSMLRQSAMIFAALLMSASASAIAAGKNELSVTQAQAHASVGKMPSSAAFLQIENKGKSDDALLSATSPAAAQVEFHTMSMEGDVMKMRAVDSIDIKAGEDLAMKPGQGYHLMLMGLKKPLKAGEKFPLTLSFRKAGKVQVSVDVVEMGMIAKPAGGGEGMHEHHELHNH